MRKFLLTKYKQANNFNKLMFNIFYKKMTNIKLKIQKTLKLNPVRY
jgi:hypothetical protein